MITKRFACDSAARLFLAIVAGAVDVVVRRPGSDPFKFFQTLATHERQQGWDVSHIIVKPKGIHQ